MKTAIAILTYNRRKSLELSLSGVLKNCPVEHVGVFDDVSNRDDTLGWIRDNFKDQGDIIDDKKYLARRYRYRNFVDFFLGTENLGVAGNSNRAIHWFMTETDADHLCLLNDDVEVIGDFSRDYREAHDKLGIGLFCMCDFKSEKYKCKPVKYLGVDLKIVERFTGIMMSMTRNLVGKIGYYDMQFGKFGEEHCDYTIRARFAGGVKVGGRDVNCIDLNMSNPNIRHQEVETSMSGDVRVYEDRLSSVVMNKVSNDYAWRNYYRDYRLSFPKSVGFSYDVGIPAFDLMMQGVPFLKE